MKRIEWLMRQVGLLVGRGVAYSDGSLRCMRGAHVMSRIGTLFVHIALLVAAPIVTDAFAAAFSDLVQRLLQLLRPRTLALVAEAEALGLLFCAVVVSASYPAAL